jgi:amino acid transporter
MATTRESKVGLIQSVAIAIGLSVSGSLFTTTVIATSIAGPTAILLTLVVAITIVLAFPAYITLAKTWPISPGHYYYTSRLLIPENRQLSQIVAWSAGWSLFFMISVFILQLLSIGSADFLHDFFPMIPATLFTAIVLTISFIIAWFGLEAVGWTEILVISILFLTITVLVVAGLLNINTNNLTPIIPNEFQGLLPVIGILYTLTFGGLLLIDLGGNIEDAETNIGKVIGTATASEILPSLLIIVVVAGVIPSAQLEGETLAFVAQQFLTNDLVIIIAVGALFATISTNLAAIPLALRYVVAGVEDGILPDKLGHRNKHGELTVPLLIMYIVSIATIPLDLSLSTMATAYTLGTVTLIALVLLVGVRLPTTTPEIFEQNIIKSSQFLRPKIVRISSLIAFIITFSVLVTTAIRYPTSVCVYPDAASGTA